MKRKCYDFQRIELGKRSRKKSQHFDSSFTVSFSGVII